jgi:hypothetical protein
MQPPSDSAAAIMDNNGREPGVLAAEPTSTTLVAPATTDTAQTTATITTDPAATATPAPTATPPPVDNGAAVAPSQ